MFICMTCGGSCSQRMVTCSWLWRSRKHLQEPHKIFHLWSWMCVGHIHHLGWWTQLLWCSFWEPQDRSLRIEPCVPLFPLDVLLILLWWVGPLRNSYKSELMESSKNTTWRLQASEKRWSRCALLMTRTPFWMIHKIHWMKLRCDKEIMRVKK